MAPEPIRHVDGQSSRPSRTGSDVLSSPRSQPAMCCCGERYVPSVRISCGVRGDDMSDSGVDPERLRARALLLRELAQARAMLGRGPLPRTPTYPTDPLRARQP